MRKNQYFWVIFFALCLLFPLSAPHAKKTAGAQDNIAVSEPSRQEKVVIIPLTNEEIQNYHTLSFKQQLSFLSDFYAKNKELGATDGQIINELIRLDMKDGKNSDLVKFLSKAKGKFKDFTSMLQAGIDDINNQILAAHPGKTEYLVDLDNSETWKNVRYLAIGGKSFDDIRKEFSVERYYSPTLQTEYGAVRIASCANLPKKKEILMSLIVSLKQGYHLLRQVEGQPVLPITADFEGSQNASFSALNYPLMSYFNLNNSKALGYAGQTLFTFHAETADTGALPEVKVKLTFDICKDGECKTETTPEMVYKFPSAPFLETPVCPSLDEAYFNVPAHKQSSVTFKKAAITEKGKDAFLYLSADLPPLNFDTPDLFISNTDGLIFDIPFLSIKDGQVVFRAKIKNPEKLKELKSVDLTLTIRNLSKSTQEDISVPVTKTFSDSTGFSVLKMFSAFFMGIKFIIFTPLLLAFSLFLYQMLFVQNKTVEKTEEFSKGMGKGFILCLALYALLFLFFFFVLPEGSFVWGDFLQSPFINFFFMAAFFTSPFWLMKIFNEEFIQKIKNKGEKFFHLCRISTNRETSGFILSLTVGLFMLVSPMVGMYFELFDILSRSPVVYFICFIAGIILPFLLFLCFAENAAQIPHRDVPLLIPGLFLQAFIQGGLLFLVISSETGRYVMFGMLLCLGVSYAVYDKFSRTEQTKKRIFITLSCLAFLFIPFTPNELDMNNFAAQPFNREILEKAVQEGKAVYVNVTESSCLVCQFNRLSMMYNGGRGAIQEGKLLIMRAGYNDPFVKELLQETGAHLLPANILFGPSAPQGMLLPEVLRPTETSMAISRIFKG